MLNTQTADDGLRVGGPSRRQPETTVEHPPFAPVESAAPRAAGKAGRVGPRKNPTLPANYIIHGWQACAA